MENETTCVLYTFQVADAPYGIIQVARAIKGEPCESDMEVWPAGYMAKHPECLSLDGMCVVRFVDDREAILDYAIY